MITRFLRRCHLPTLGVKSGSYVYLVDRNRLLSLSTKAKEQRKWSVVPILKSSRFSFETKLENPPDYVYITKSKSMSDSYIEEYLPIKSDPGVREDYINVYGHIRVGRLLEHLDALAGSISYAHCDDGVWVKPPLMIVTGKICIVKSLNSSEC